MEKRKCLASIHWPHHLQSYPLLSRLSNQAQEKMISLLERKLIRQSYSTLLAQQDVVGCGTPLEWQLKELTNSTLLKRVIRKCSGKHWLWQTDTVAQWTEQRSWVLENEVLSLTLARKTMYVKVFCKLWKEMDFYQSLAWKCLGQFFGPCFPQW